MSVSRLRALLPLFLLGCSSASSTPVATPDAAQAADAGTTLDAAPDAATDGSTQLVTTVYVHYTAAGATAMGLRGDASGLSWDADTALEHEGDAWVFRAPAAPSPIALKPRFDGLWSQGPNYVVQPGTTAHLYPRFSTTAGALSHVDALLQHDGRTRGAWVYLPPTYLENTAFEAPVLYMHDGQNLFDDAVAFGGQSWRAANAMNAGAESGAIREAIVVGIDNDADRMKDYTPVTDSSYGGGGGDAFLAAIVAQLKPAIDARYRTLASRDHTLMMGSSLGGLLSLRAATTQAQTFGHIGAMSPSTWWANRWVLGDIATLKTALVKPTRIYVDSGDSGQSNDDVANTRQLAAALRDAGYADGSTLKYLVGAGDSHNEAAWARRLPAALAFLLGPRALQAP